MYPCCTMSVADGCCATTRTTRSAPHACCARRSACGPDGVWMPTPPSCRLRRSREGKSIPPGTAHRHLGAAESAGLPLTLSTSGRTSCVMRPAPTGLIGRWWAATTSRPQVSPTRWWRVNALRSIRSRKAPCWVATPAACYARLRRPGEGHATDRSPADGTLSLRPLLRSLDSGQGVA
jgi:hypothetical protein